MWLASNPNQPLAHDGLSGPLARRRLELYSLGTLAWIAFDSIRRIPPQEGPPVHNQLGNDHDRGFLRLAVVPLSISRSNHELHEQPLEPSVSQLVGEFHHMLPAILFAHSLDASLAEEVRGSDAELEAPALVENIAAQRSPLRHNTFLGHTRHAVHLFPILANQNEKPSLQSASS